MANIKIDNNCYYKELPLKKHNSEPLVSVVIPAYNEEKTIEDCIKSFLKQSYPNVEIIVVDDGSTDNTYKIAKNHPIKSIKFEKNRGVSCARNIGIREANGEFILFAEADGIYSSKYISVIIKPLHDGKIGSSIAGQRIPLSSRNNLLVKFWNIRFKAQKIATLKGSRPVIGAWAFRKEIFEKVGIYDNTLICGEDVDLANRIKKAGYKLAAMIHIEDSLEHVLFETSSYVLFAIPEKCCVYHKEPDTLKQLIKRTWWGSINCKKFRLIWDLEPSGINKILFVARNIAVLALPLYLVLFIVHNSLWIILFFGVLFAESIFPIMYSDELKSTIKLALENKEYKVALAMPLICWIEIRARAFGNFYAMIKQKRDSQ